VLLADPESWISKKEGSKMEETVVEVPGKARLQTARLAKAIPNLEEFEKVGLEKALPGLTRSEMVRRERARPETAESRV
jgi:hypothetical protein